LPGVRRKYRSGTGLLIYVEHVEVAGSEEVRSRCYLGWACRLRRDDRAELKGCAVKWWSCVVGRRSGEEVEELAEGSWWD
jgi:hypothetical protein